MSPELKIVRVDTVLHVVQTPRLWPMTIGTLCLILVLISLAGDWSGHKTYGRVAWDVLGVVLPLIGFFTYMSPRDYEFDKAARKLTWGRRWLWWKQGGELPFEDITDAAVAADADTVLGRKVEDWRLILRMKEDAIARLQQGRQRQSQLMLGTEEENTIVICDADSSQARSHCEEVATRIREVLNNPRA